MDFNNIYITGFMGSGKSTVGRILAGKLGFKFIDLDRIIEIDQGKKIKDIFKLDREKYFRDIETKVIEKTCRNKNCVFACGGGVVERKRNMDIICRSGLVIYLDISIQDALKRLKYVKDRPLLEVSQREETIKDLLSKREALYRKYSDLVVSNIKRSAEHTADEIMTRLKA
jgi:shikimate kinase